MIERERSNDGRLERYVLRPHQGATWSDNLLLFVAIAAAAVPVAAGWAMLGFWPILPLCGLELAFVLLALYAANHRLLAREVVTFDPDRITIEAGRRRVERRFELPRPWARVSLQPPAGPLRPSRLIVRSHGTAIELARFLTEDERRALARELAETVAQPPARAGGE